MKATHVGIFSCLGMFLVGGAVFAVTPSGGFGATKERRSSASIDEDKATTDSSSGSGDGHNNITAKSNGASFIADGTLVMEGRLGHSALLASAPEETYVMLELRGDEKVTGAPAPAALSIVIDRSGSMSGARWDNAISAAVKAVEQLRDGDSVSVVAFDTRADKIQPLTTISGANRQTIIQAIRGIALGGDTCISCGIEAGLADLKAATSLSANVVQRMIVLSDGKTNNGIRDVAGFNSLGQRAMSQGVNITTIGVDIDFDEKVMSAIALSSNGRHYFVENETGLQKVFEEEAKSVTASVANNAIAELDLAQGVELVKVFDRNFSRAGNHLSVPLGAFSRGEVKTVLVKVRIPKGETGTLNVASVRLSYRDVTTEKDVVANGKLSLELVDQSSSVSALDALVLDRAQRSDTATALREANTLFNQGKTDEARRRLERQVSANAAAKPRSAPAPAGRAKDIDRSFDSQNAELNKAATNFGNGPPMATASPAGGGAPAAPPRPQAAQVKRSEEKAADFGL